MGPCPMKTRHVGHPRASMVSRLTTPYLKAMLNDGDALCATGGGDGGAEEAASGDLPLPRDHQRICCSGKATACLLSCPGATPFFAGSEPETRRVWLLPLATGLK